MQNKNLDKYINANANNPNRPEEQDDLSASQHPDWAIFLPSVSSVYVRTASRKPKTNENGEVDIWGIHQRGKTMKKLVPNDLNFLDPNNKFFFYPWALYSAGHAELELDRFRELESMMAERDKEKTWVLGDSGGYQAATGVLNYPWKIKTRRVKADASDTSGPASPPYNKGDIVDIVTDKKGNKFHLIATESSTDLKKRQDEFKIKILRWLEDHSNYAMTFDFPTFAYEIPRARENGLKSFDDCFEGTKENFKFFAKHRNPNSFAKFYTVLQGLNMSERDLWYEEFKDPNTYPFEGWAWAIAASSDVYALLDRLIKMAREGRLQDRKPMYLHFLGNGKISAAIAYTAIQRALRKYVNPEIYITFDASSPYVTAARGEMYTGFFFDGTDKVKAKGSSYDEFGKVAFNSDMIIDNKDLAGDTTPLDWTYTVTYGNQINPDKQEVFKSPISKYLTVGDICVFGNDEYGSKYSRSLDVLSYVLAMQHNTYVHCKAIQTGNKLFDSCTLEEANKYFPNKLIKFGHTISVHDLFSDEDYQKYKDVIKGADENGNFAGYIEAIFANLDSDIPEKIISFHEKSLRDLCDMGFNEFNEAEVLDGGDDPDTAMEKEIRRQEYEENLKSNVEEKTKVNYSVFDGVDLTTTTTKRKKKGVSKTEKVVKTNLFQF